MIYTTNNLIEKYKDYGNPKTKINRLLHNGTLFSLSKGVYTDDKQLDPFVVASILCGPSYVSFHKALEYYDLIPERACVITCATCNKRKSKTNKNYFGNFNYSDVPSEVYSYGVLMKDIGEYTYYIATPEKALCDLLYKLKPVKNMNQIKELLIDNLRIEKNDLLKLNINDIKFLANNYHCNNVKYLYKFLRSQHD